MSRKFRPSMRLGFREVVIVELSQRGRIELEFLKMIARDFDERFGVQISPEIIEVAPPPEFDRAIDGRPPQRRCEAFSEVRVLL
jgi:hypothetical protein